MNYPGLRRRCEVYLYQFWRMVVQRDIFWASFQKHITARNWCNTSETNAPRNEIFVGCTLKTVMFLKNYYWKIKCLIQHYRSFNLTSEWYIGKRTFLHFYSYMTAAREVYKNCVHHSLKNLIQGWKIIDFKYCCREIQNCEGRRKLLSKRQGPATGRVSP